MCGGKAWTAIRRSTPSTGRARTGRRKHRPRDRRKAAHPNARFTVAATNNPATRPGLGRPGRRADRCLHLRRPPLDHGAAGDRGQRLGRRRLHGRHDGLRDHRRHHRPAGRGAPRSVRDAALHGLQHVRLLPALAEPGPQAAGQRRQAAEDLHDQLVPQGRRRQVRVARLRREHARAQVDDRPHRRQGPRRAPRVRHQPRLPGDQLGRPVLHQGAVRPR